MVAMAAANSDTVSHTTGVVDQKFVPHTNCWSTTPVVCDTVPGVRP
ncbi:hypothetical protein Pla163_31100 [Planctomycetes bacterium Pla163]|uniref:Uncharacterized protein n=1 Tax=Rohdeia mirabilis TaxID=2528008 RepID=A0A518D3A8_9BACT|nr:hypothetical protein Pla163_31100 [Planctomycetes bacterium Pla163]